MGQHGYVDHAAVEGEHTESAAATALSKRSGRSPGQNSSAGPLTLAHQSSPARLTSWAAITLRWISFVPSPTIISGASRK